MILIKVKGMHCDKCAQNIKNGLKELGSKIVVNLSKQEITLESDKQFDEIKKVIEDLGYQVKTIKKITE